MTQKLTRCEQSDFIWTSWSRFVNRKRREREEVQNQELAQSTHMTLFRNKRFMLDGMFKWSVCQNLPYFWNMYKNPSFFRIVYYIILLEGKQSSTNKYIVQKFSFQFESMTFHLAQTSYFCRMFYLTGLVKSTFSTFFVHFKLCGIPSEK